VRFKAYKARELASTLAMVELKVAMSLVLNYVEMKLLTTSLLLEEVIQNKARMFLPYTLSPS
jgi:hypothetical protein